MVFRISHSIYNNISITNNRYSYIRKKKSKKINKSNVEDEYKRNNKLIIKILVALLISIFVSIIVFYGIGIAILIGLQEGR